MEVNDHPAKDERVNQEIKEELKRFMETNENEDTTVFLLYPKQNLWDTAKAVLKGNTLQYKHTSQNWTNSKTQANLAPKGAAEGTANRSYTQQKRVNKDLSRTQ